MGQDKIDGGCCGRSSISRGVKVEREDWWGSQRSQEGIGKIIG